MSELMHESASVLIDELLRRGWREGEDDEGEFLREPKTCAAAKKAERTADKRIARTPVDSKDRCEFFAPVPGGGRCELKTGHVGPHWSGDLSWGGVGLQLYLDQDLRDELARRAQKRGGS